MPDQSKKNHRVIIGAELEAPVDSVLDRHGLSPSDATLFVRRSNPIVQVSRYDHNIVMVSEPHETRLSQVRRLFTELRRHRFATYFWRPVIGFVRNLSGLLFLCIICGLQTEVIYRGQAYSSRDFILLRFLRLPTLGFEPVAWLLVIWALFTQTVRNTVLWLRRQIGGLLFWFRPTISTVSNQEIAETFARVSSRYFELEESLYSASRTTRTIAFARLCLQAILCLLFGVLYWPWSLMNRLCRSVPDRKRILLVSHESRMNGAPAGLVTIFESLDRDEFEPYLLTASEGLLTQRARAADIPTFVLPLSQCLTQFPSSRGLMIAAIRMAINFPFLLYLLVTLRISLVQTNVLVTPDTAITAKLLGLISIWHFREFISNNLWALFQVQVMNLFSDRILCNSEYSRQVINQKGIFWSKMVIVHDVLDQRQVKGHDSGSQFRNSLRLGPSQLLIGCVGQITQVKGQEFFVKAAIEIAQEYSHVHFVLIGTLENGPYVQHLQDMIHQADLDHRFTFTGFRTDIYEIMAALDIHVTPSVWAEAFGRVALETMGTGVVSVVSATGGLREIVEHDVSGVQFPPGDAEALKQVLSRLIKEPEYRERLRKNGIKRSRLLFSVEKQADILQQTYRYPKHFASRLSYSRVWITLQKYLPGRLRPHPKLLVYYPLLVMAVSVLWFVGLGLFFCALPLAMLGGKIRHSTRSKRHVAVLAYQTNRNAATRHRITKLFRFIPQTSAVIRFFYPSSDWLADKVYVALFYGDRPHIRDAYFYVVVFLNRLYSILCCYSYHTVVIQYELFHEGPMWMELLVARSHPRVIYDYDDSLYVFPRYKRWLPRLLCRVNHVVVGNRFLAEYTRQFNSNISYVPTCPDLSLLGADFKPCALGRMDSTVYIGWAGNPAGLYYLPTVTKAIRRLVDEYMICFVIISSGPYDTAWLDLEGLPIKRMEWNLEREMLELRSLDVGLMPVIDDELGRGKCGFKALQYMAAGVPCVLSPVGVNAQIVEHGVTGFFATSEEEWYCYLKQLIESPQLRASIASAAFEHVHEQFDMKNWSRVWEHLFLEDGATK